MRCASPSSDATARGRDGLRQEAAPEDQGHWGASEATATAFSTKTNHASPPWLLMTEPLNPPPQPPPLPLPASAPWGFWPTMGLSLALFAVFVLVQAVVAVAFAGFALVRDRAGWLDALETNGLFLALTTCASAPVTVGLTWLFASWRKGMPARDYLAWHRVTPGTLARWCGVLLVWLAIADLLTLSLGRPVVPDFMIQAWQTAGFWPLLLLALIVCAPAAEEVWFRGFMFQGLQHSRLGWPGAIVVSSFLWAVIHLQYDAYQMSLIFVSGLLLGYARWKTRSLLTPVAMHALQNLAATVELLVSLPRAEGVP